MKSCSPPMTAACDSHSGWMAEALMVCPEDSKAPPQAQEREVQAEEDTVLLTPSTV